MNNLVTNSDSESIIVGVLNASKNSTSTCKVNITTRFDVKNHKLNTQYIAKGGIFFVFVRFFVCFNPLYSDHMVRAAI